MQKTMKKDKIKNCINIDGCFFSTTQDLNEISKLITENKFLIINYESSQNKSILNVDLIKSIIPENTRYYRTIKLEKIKIIKNNWIINLINIIIATIKNKK